MAPSCSSRNCREQSDQNERRVRHRRVLTLDVLLTTYTDLIRKSRTSRSLQLPSTGLEMSDDFIRG
jgi:hypothetical protein